MNLPYKSLSEFLKSRYGCKVFKITINAGFTCPNRDGTKGVGGCVYCEPATILPKECVDSDIKGQIASGMERVWLRHKAEKFIAYFQINTNTHATIDKLREIYSHALIPEVAAIAISTRPDCVNDEVLGLLSELKEKKSLWLELGLQSSKDETLKLINRAHTSADFEDAVKRAGSLGIDVCAHLILGLPGESTEDMFDTMRFVSRLKVWGVKLHQLQVIKGTVLEGMYNRGEVNPLGLEEYAGLVVKCLELIPPDTIVHRLCGDVPERFLAAPRWGANKFMITDLVLKAFSEMATHQGAKFTGPKQGI